VSKSEADADKALNKLTKWRSIFAGWQLGTRPKGEPESDAVRDHREVTVLMRAELNALVTLLIKNGTFSREEWLRCLANEADLLSKAYEMKFPGMHATEDGIEMDVRQAQETMRRMNFKP
jgi:hypothetical protein